MSAFGGKADIETSLRRSVWLEVGELRHRQWIGIGAPANTPATIIERLNGEANATLADAKEGARTVPSQSPPEHATFPSG
jgi:hypothetical protein